SHASATLGRSLLVASYLFDHSDVTRAEDVSLELRDLTDRCDAERLVVVTNKQRRPLSKVFTRLFAEVGWKVTNHTLETGPMEGIAEATMAFRQEFLTHQGVTGQIGIDVDFARAEGAELLDLRRGEVRPVMFLDEQVPWRRLNRQQEQVAESGSDRQVVVGAAGSGKSVVLVEALAQRLETDRQTQSFLVTSFNKGVVVQLEQWLAERMTDRRWTRQERSEAHIEWVNVGAADHHVTFMNWDKVPTQLFGVSRVDHGGSLTASIREELQQLRVDNQDFSSLPADSRLLDPEFYMAEFRRVVFGKSATRIEDYLAVRRTGRGTGLPRHQRQMVWHVLRQQPRSFTNVRIDAAKATILPCFDEVFIDEGQDFLRADYEIAWKMLRHPKAFIVVDEAQALHVGASYEKPPAIDGRRFTYRKLQSSYRLPPSVSKAVSPLAAQVQALRKASGNADPDTALPNSRRASVIGVRPIVIVGDPKELAEQIVEIKELYAEYIDMEEGDATTTVLERDAVLSKALVDCGVHVDNSTVRKIKGLERRFVVWSVAQPIVADEVHLESVYTALTRTSCLLIIALPRAPIPIGNAEVLTMLDIDALLAWTEEAATAISSRSKLPTVPNNTDSLNGTRASSRSAKKSETVTPSKSAAQGKPARSGQKWDSEEVALVVKHWNNGETVKGIASQLDRTQGAIRSRLRKLGFVI
ncbi:hypothetical protein N9R50_01555, partial [bacterium]|nr:hypothetical protein [bacterium]